MLGKSWKILIGGAWSFKLCSISWLAEVGAKVAERMRRKASLIQRDKNQPLARCDKLIDATSKAIANTKCISTSVQYKTISLDFASIDDLAIEIVVLL
jgi:hypothetical protein